MLIITPDEPNLYADHVRLTENEYNLIVYCLEQQLSEFNKDEQNDANSIIDKLSTITEVNKK